MLAAYIMLDPFKVIRHYDNYYEVGNVVPMNRGMVTTMNYINKKDSIHYNSFIMGNSRSAYYFIDDWKKHLDNDSRCYHFSEHGGSVAGLYLRTKYVHENGEIIKNALLVLDSELLSTTEYTDPKGVIPPVLTGYHSAFSFHKTNLIAWFNLDFFISYFRYHITKKITPYMSQYIMKGTNYPFYNPQTNEEPQAIQDSLIAVGNYYNETIINGFKNEQYPDSISPVAINEEREEMLRKTKIIFDKQKTKYKIVISPLYNQIKINPKDLSLLNTVFGKENVYDFSGVNHWTKDFHNYYEPSHYLPRVAAEIMDSIYTSRK